MSTQVDGILEGMPNGIHMLFHGLREIMLASHPRITEEFLGGSKVKMGYYSIDERNNAVGVIGPAKDHVKLFFHHFDKIDSFGLKLEGSGKHSRHVKFRVGDDIEVAKRILKQVTAIASNQS